jgi:all-trans-8'-apo-beta-carotenal 15,15'-oxygenase
MDRREFCYKTLSVGATLGLPFSPWNNTPDQGPLRPSYWAHQNLEVQGLWRPRRIEGQIPLDLTGSLYRFGPGKKNTFGQKLNHYFDGDGFVSRFDFGDGQISVVSEFVETEARKQESQAKKMLYLEFGTKPQGKIRGLKNSPNINGIIWQDQLLVLSESAAPYSLKPENLKTQGPEHFQNSLPKNLGFSAHSQIEESSGDLISFGFTQELSPQFQIYKISKRQSRVQEVHRLKLGGFYPVHDVSFTEDYMIFLIPPLQVNLWGAALGNKPVADLLKLDEKKNLQLLICDLAGQSKPLLIDTGFKKMNFHHVRSWREGHFLYLDSFIIDDFSIYETFKTWSQEMITGSSSARLVRFKIDLNLKKLAEWGYLSDPLWSDFPKVLEQKKFVSIAATHPQFDPLGFNQILLWDQDSGQVIQKMELSSGEILSEVVACGNYLIHLGHSLNQKESFLDVRDSQTLKPIARAWLGNSHPLGFHGFFTAK